MTTCFVRHGRTSYSSRHLVNGDPRVPVPLDDEGILCARRSRSLVREMGIRTCRTSSFPRTRQTADLLLEGNDCPRSVDACLDEPDYGMFEGRSFLEYASWLKEYGPTARPPGSRESQHEALLRMLEGCARLPFLSAPRMVVAHGFLLSALNWCHSRHSQSGFPLFLPEASYLEPLVVSDRCLLGWVKLLSEEVHRGPCSNEGRGAPQISSEDDRTVLHPPRTVRTPLEENEFDA
ncbi:histidine phosphatase family protein [Nocardiopsis alba]|uniref:histidine phosphatase family protein n=1 Tax=Nocardiopsis alba TaxID=53437 RepID=UPI0033D76990